MVYKYHFLNYLFESNYDFELQFIKFNHERHDILCYIIVLRFADYLAILSLYSSFE